MSCYVVDKKVIDLMVSWIFDHNDYKVGDSMTNPLFGGNYDIRTENL